MYNIVLGTWMCGESWLAIKDSLTTVPVLKSEHPSVLLFTLPFINLTNHVHYVYCLSGLPFFPSLASVLCTCISMYVCACMCVHVCVCTLVCA